MKRNEKKKHTHIKMRKKQKKEREREKKKEKEKQKLNLGCLLLFEKQIGATMRYNKWALYCLLVITWWTFSFLGLILFARANTMLLNGCVQQ